MWFCLNPVGIEEFGDKIHASGKEKLRDGGWTWRGTMSHKRLKQRLQRKRAPEHTTRLFPWCLKKQVCRKFGQIYYVSEMAVIPHTIQKGRIRKQPIRTLGTQLEQQIQHISRGQRDGRATIRTRSQTKTRDRSLWRALWRSQGSFSRLHR